MSSTSLETPAITDIDRELLLQERLRSFRAPVWLTAAANLFCACVMARVATKHSGIDGVTIGIWLAVFAGTLPLRMRVLRKIDRTPGWRHSKAAGLMVACLGGAFFGFAGTQFTVGMNEIGMFKTLGILVLVSFSSMTMHALFRGRMSAFMALTWIPFVYRLIAPDSDFIPELLVAVLMALTMIGLVTWSFTSVCNNLLNAQIERELSAISLEKKQSELEKAHNEQHIFFLAANHDIRQPLQALGSYALALEQTLPEAAVQPRQLLGKLQGSIRTLGNLIDETLRFAKIASGEEKPMLKIFPAQKLVEKLRTEYATAARQKGIALRIRDSDLSLFTDPVILERVLGNLISNALRYTDEGGVLVALRRRNGGCVIEVWDTGIGISLEEQDQVFQTFYQGSNRKTVSTGAQRGYGIGLSIVKRLCSQIDTALELKSRVNRGTCVKVAIPTATSPAYFIDDALDHQNIIQNFTGATIAVVEDDPAIRESLSAILAGAHAQVVEASNLAELTAKIAGVDQIDFMVADLHIAGELGTDMILAARRKFPHMGAVIVTGDASEPTLRKLRLEGYQTILKPVEPHALMSLIFDNISSLQRAAAMRS